MVTLEDLAKKGRRKFKNRMAEMIENYKEAMTEDKADKWYKRWIEAMSK